jgi:hypothetical protein
MKVVYTMSALLGGQPNRECSETIEPLIDVQIGVGGQLHLGSGAFRN